MHRKTDPGNAAGPTSELFLMVEVADVGHAFAAH
jgi:hypothetical protein